MKRITLMSCLGLTAAVLVLSGCNLLVGPPTDACCNPDDKPGNGDNPVCVEGATCCADGQWACNNGDGRSTCDAICMGRTCGGIAGVACFPGEVCQLPVGVCNYADLFGVCRPRPGACIEIYQPVCGCDGQTYSNDCHALRAGVSIAFEGECGQACGGPLDVACPATEFCRQDLGGCLDPDATGVCTARPEACITLFEPVCGCDGQTYSNECVAWSSGVSAASSGACQ